MEADREQVSFGEVQTLALRLLSRREHSVHELRHKLNARGFDDETVEAVITTLIGEGSLSDSRFAGEYVRMRTGKGYGPLRIRAELGERGIDDSLIAQALDDWEGDWLTLAERVRQRKFGGTPPRDWNERVRQSRFLQYRGFDSDTIGRLMRIEA